MRTNRLGLRGTIGLVLVVLGLGLPGGAAAAEEQGPVFTLIEENDLVVDSDRHYTQGIRLSYLHADGFLPFGMSNVYSALPEIWFRSEIGKFGYAVGQNIYTPSDTDIAVPPPGERPYAGWLYLGVILQRRGTSFGNRMTQEDLELDLGVIGPWALGQEAQDWVHDIRGLEEAQGWRRQLRNEPGLRFRYQRSVRFPAFQVDSFEGEFLPHAGFALGNVETSLRAGWTGRVGVNLPDDFGLQTIDSLAASGSGRPKNGPLRTRWHGYAFGGVEGRFVGYNAFLDGNLFHNSPDVDKNYVVGDFKVGFAVGYRAVEVGYTHIWRTAEYKNQDKDDSFGAAFFRWRF